MELKPNKQEGAAPCSQYIIHGGRSEPSADNIPRRAGCQALFLEGQADDSPGAQDVPSAAVAQELKMRILPIVTPSSVRIKMRIP